MKLCYIMFVIVIKIKVWSLNWNRKTKWKPVKSKNCKMHVFNQFCKNQIVVKNLRIVAQWLTLSESHLLRLYFGVFQPSVVKITKAQWDHKHSSVPKWNFDKVKNQQAIILLIPSKNRKNSEKLAGSVWPSLSSSGDHPHPLHCHLSLSAVPYTC